MTSLLANIDPAFKTLAPRAADWLSILPEIAVAGLALLCLLQALLLPPAQRWLQPATARVGLLLVLVMSLTSGTAWNLPHGAENFPASFFTGADSLPAFRGLLRVQLENSEAVRLSSSPARSARASWPAGSCATAASRWRTTTTCC
jgi:hypothetical protein